MKFIYYYKSMGYKENNEAIFAREGKYICALHKSHGT